MLEKKTKIIATIGPASRSKEMLWNLYQAGANVFRLNFSHGSHDDHLQTITWIRELNEENGANICMLQDLQGPKIRTNMIEGGAVEVKEGDTIQIAAGDFEGNAKRISTTYQTIAEDLKVGEAILIDDGNIELKVESIANDEVTARFINGGVLKSRKGINLPESDLSVPSLTEKDEKDLLFGIEQDVDWIALSFVRNAKDIIDLKKTIADAGRQIGVIAKIEKPEAIDNMDAIIEVTDALMVARGDLGVEVEMEKVPLIQKELVQKCNKAAKPVIIATQMMESMITNPRPTRAEANDVANAILDGTDVVMLSAETAAGDYPIQAVGAMSKIIQNVEKNTESIYNKFDPIDGTTETNINESLLFSACRVAEHTDSQAIVAMSGSGFSAYEIAKRRPKTNIFVFTPDKSLITRLSLIWGVRAYHYNDETKSTDDTIDNVNDILLKKGDIKKGDTIVNTLGMPVWKGGRTNTLKISKI
ncbi:MAG: pyruvate kinase [Cyclobacteriaceae bacterium]